MEERIISKELIARVLKGLYLFHYADHAPHSTFWHNIKANGGGGNPGSALADKMNADS